MSSLCTVFIVLIAYIRVRIHHVIYAVPLYDISSFVIIRNTAHIYEISVFILSYIHTVFIPLFRNSLDYHNLRNLLERNHIVIKFCNRTAIHPCSASSEIDIASAVIIRKYAGVNHSPAAYSNNRHADINEAVIRVITYRHSYHPLVIKCS